MAATSYRYVVYSILTELQMAFPDAEIEVNQVLFWTRNIENRIRKRHIEVTPTGAFLVYFPSVPVLLDGTRKYILLPSPVYDLAYENGIEYITYVRTDIVAFTQTVFHPTSPSESARLYYNPYETPSPAQPYFYRLKDRIYFLGVENIKLKQVEIGMYAALDPRSSMVDLDDTIELNEEQVHQLRIELLNLGRYIMAIPSYREETGTDDRSVQQAQALKTSLTMQQADAQAQQDAEV